MLNTTPPTDCPAWAKLQHHAESWRTVHTPEGLARVQEAWPRALRNGEPYEIE